jgi:hypothetical protein
MLKLTATTASKSVANDYGWHFACGHPGEAIRFVQGGKMRTLPAAFSELAAALQFPWYFGENLAALVDCIGDLSWLSDNILIIVYDADLVLAEDDKPSFYAALGRAAEAFSEADNPLHPDRTSPALFQLLFQCDPDKLDRVERDARLLGNSCEIVDAAATVP